MARFFLAYDQGLMRHAGKRRPARLQGGACAAVNAHTETTCANANHGSHNDATPRYDKDSADPGWPRTIEFLRQNLV